MKFDLKILIVEDEIISALSLAQDLQQHNYTVWKMVDSGEKALQKVAEERPDVIFMDIRLRGRLNGLETAQQINARLGIPIIFMTGLKTETVMEQLKDINPIGFFPKPVQINEVIKLLQSYFNIK